MFALSNNFSKLNKERLYVKNLRIADVANLYFPVKNPEKKESYAKCPFCHHKMGTFYLYNDTNLFKCFACDAQGDIIEIVSKLFNLKFVVALDKIYSDVTNKYGRSLDNVVTNNNNINLKSNREQKVHPSFTDLAIRIFLKSVKLNPKDRDYLMTNRHLTNDEINQLGFFTMPQNSDEFLERLEKETIKAGYITNIFQFMPGMYTTAKLKTNQKSINGDPIYKYTFKYTKGIGIPAKNSKGYYTGIQVKVDQKFYQNKLAKYLWFSSKESVIPKYAFNGTPSGTPIATFINDQSQVLDITEGFFKGYTIFKKTGNSVFALSGVNATSQLDTELKGLQYILANQKKSIKKVNLLFDSDLAVNVNVLKALSKLAVKLNKKLKVMPNIILWNMNYGKGIDDLLNNYPNFTNFKTPNAKIFIEKLRIYKNNIYQSDYSDNNSVKIKDNLKFNAIFNL